jgi:hypothetical protein
MITGLLTDLQYEQLATVAETANVAVLRAFS